jgi:EAL domain-containing protein (putative c-di-GMP-specific phosphodiesterase class I)
MSDSDQENRQHLLICDDDPQIGQLIATVASALGYEVKIAANIEALAVVLDTWRPTCVVLDLLMPGTDGIAGIKLLAQKKINVPLVLVSGVGERILETARTTARAYGFATVVILAKPFHLTDVRTVLTSFAEEKVLTVDASVKEVERPLRPDDLEEALKNHRIQPFYQPQVHCRGQALAGFEALARWQTKDGGVIMPARFIPLADASGLIDALTDEMARTGIRWLAESFPGLPVSLALNVAVQSLTRPFLLERLSQYCQRWSISTQQIVLELTEGGAVDNDPAVLAELTRARMMGFCLSLDDFGTGYSSLLELAQLPFTELKIDQTFVRTMLDSKESRAVITLALDLARDLGLTTVAEGVESAAVVDRLCAAGCHKIQGYYIARPMEGDRAVAWARRRMEGLNHPDEKRDP